MAIYLVLYIAAFMGYAAHANASKRKRFRYVVVLFGLLTLVAAIRNHTVGIDLILFYGKYYPQFASVPWNKIQTVTMSGDWELGFCALNKLLAMITPNFQMFIFVTSILTVVPYGVFIYKNSEDVVFSTVMYIGFHIFSQTLNIVRQCIAIGIILLGLEALKQKKYIKFSIYVVIASFFHTSAIIAFVYLIFERLKFKKYTFYLLAIVTVLFAIGYRFLFEKLLLYTGLSSMYGIYSSTMGRGDSGYVTFNSLGMFSIALLIFVLGCIFLNGNTSQTPIEVMSLVKKRYDFSKGVIRIHRNVCEYIYWPESLLMYAVYMSVLFRFAAFIINVTSRLALYFFPFLVISIPHTCSKAKASDKKIIYGIMYMVLTVYFLVIGFAKAESMWGTVPYKFFWE